MTKNPNLKRIKDLFILRAGGDVDKIKQSEKGYPIYANSAKDSDVYGYSENYQYNGEAITVCARGNLGYPIYRNTPFSAIGRLIVAHKKLNLNVKYTYYAMKTLQFNGNDTAIPQLTVPEFKEYKICYFENREHQDLIANYLDNKTSKIDSAVTELEKQKSLLIELKKSTIHQAVTKGLDMTVPMKDSGVEWIGKVPSHWDIIRVSGAFNYLQLKKADEGLSDYLEIGDVNILTNRYDLTKKEKKSVSGAKLAPKDTLLISTVRPIRGGITVTEKAQPVSSAFCSFKLTDRFLFYVVKNSKFLKELTKTSMDTTYPTCKDKDICNQVIGLPNKEERASIVDYLDKKTGQIDSAVTELEKQKSLLIELKKSTIHQAVTKGLDLTVPMKDSGVEWIGKVPSHWEIKRIKDKLINLGGGKYGEDEGKLKLDIPCISISDFRNGNISTNKKIKMKRSYSTSNIMQKGTLLVEKSGGGEKTPVGRVIMIEKDIEAYYTNFVASLKTLENEKFCYYLMKNIHNRRIHMPFVKQNTGLQNFDYNGFSLFQKVGFPSSSEQKKIADYLDNKTSKIDSAVTELEKQKSLLIELKKSTIHQAVTKGLDMTVPMKDSGI